MTVRNRIVARLGPWHESAIVGLLFVTLDVAIASIERARWINPQPSLTFVLFLAVLAGWLVGRKGPRSAAAFPLAVISGVVVTAWQAVWLQRGGVEGTGISRAAEAIEVTWQTLTTADPSESTLFFAVFLTVLTWMMGFVSTWFLLRKRNPWVGVALGIAALLVNLNNLPAGRDSVFFLSVLMSLFLVGMTSLAKDRDGLEGRAFPVRALAYYAAALIVLSALSIAGARFTPAVKAEGLEKLVSRETLLAQDIEDRIAGFLSAVPEKQPMLRNTSRKALLFGDSSFDQGSEPQFVIVSERPSYWRSRLYDVYSPTGWTSSETLEQTDGQGTQGLAGGGSRRQDMTFTLIPQLKTDILLTSGEFISSDVPVSVTTLAPASFTIDLTRAAADRSLPPDVANAARSMRTARNLDPGISAEGLSALLPPDLAITSPLSQPSGPGPAAIEVARRLPNPDAAAVTSLFPLKADRSYLVTSRFSVATPDELSRAGDEYPRSVTDFYQQLPPNLPGRVRELSRRITSQRVRPYDKVVAVKDYLAQFGYELEGLAPPQGIDGVDYFLFAEKSGNCVNFASAMAVMLRSVGIPSRLAAGYEPGEWNAATGRTVLTAKERHAWTEVYFPGYGWVGFDPTPGAGGQGISEEDLPAGSSSGSEEELFPEDFGGGGLPLTGGGSPADPRGAALPWIILILVGGAAFWVAMVWPALRRGDVSGRPGYPLEVYRKMCALASLAGMGPKPYHTPLEYKARLTASFPEQADTLGNIVDTYAATAYSPRKDLGRWERFRLRQSWLAMRRVLVRRVFRLR